VKMIFKPFPLHCHHHLTKCVFPQVEYFGGEDNRWCTGKQILLSQSHSRN
jgi:hypothetical protein